MGFAHTKLSSTVYESELSCDPQDFAEAWVLVHG